VIPQTLGKYKVVGPLGKGSTGVVYRAARQDSNIPVVIKEVAPERLPTPQAREQFLEEANDALLLNHIRLRQLLDVIEADGKIFLALEYLEGATLKSLLVSGPVEPEAALAWGAELADALAATHDGGVVHGELTPAKVFITQEGTVRLLDPGLWRLSVPTGADLSDEARLNASGLSAAAVAALAPEQISGAEPDPRSDIFSLGVLVHQMITGRQPFLEPALVDTMYCVLRRTPAPVSELVPEAPQALDAVLARAMEKDPEKRFASAGELAGALRAVAAGEEVPREGTAAPTVEAAVARSAKLVLSPIWLALGAVGLLLVIWFLVLAFSWR
jgi:serine/threonine protein kinase